jgi:hypothetical protein
MQLATLTFTSGVSGRSLPTQEDDGIPQRVADRASKLLLAYTFVWIFEGAVRKWTVSGLQQPMYFARVPIVILIFLLALRNCRNPLPRLAIAAGGLSLFVLVFVAMHVIAGDETITQAVLGGRLFLEAFVTPIALAPFTRQRDALRICRWLLRLAPPLFSLALLQVLSPSSSIVNKLLASDGHDNFVNVGGVVRATSTFTSSLGYEGFITMVLASGVLLLRHGIGTEDRLLAVTGILLAPIMAFTCGSRGVNFFLILMVITGIAFQTSWRPASVPWIVLGGGLMVALIAILAPRVAPDAVDALMARLFGPGANTEASGRMYGGFTTWTSRYPGDRAFGNGLGTTIQGLHNAGPQASTVEVELEQWVVEFGPYLFPLALILRWGSCLAIIARVFRARRQEQVCVSILAAAALPVWTVGILVGQGSSTGFAVVAACLLIIFSRPAPNVSLPASLNQQARHNAAN